MSQPTGAAKLVLETLHGTGRLYLEFPAAAAAQVAKAAELMARALQDGRKIIWFGNGGSATQSQHMAAEFVGRFLRERRSLPSVSLTENMASVTAIGNDYGYEQIFSRQLEGLGQPGDVVVALSTSGNSPNVLKGIEQAKTMKLPVIGLTGGTGGKMAGLCDVSIVVPSIVTARIQEVHLTIGHLLCGLVEDALAAPAGPRRA
jgi:D-sedoheptulose 7-phosphate isomerase